MKKLAMSYKPFPDVWFDGIVLPTMLNVTEPWNHDPRVNGKEAPCGSKLMLHIFSMASLSLSLSLRNAI